LDVFKWTSDAWEHNFLETSRFLFAFVPFPLLFIVGGDFPGNESYREEAFDFFRAVIQNKLRYSSAIPGTAARMHVLYKNSLHLRRTLLEITYSPHALHGPRAI
jgi:hypothetical protein